MSSVSVLHTKCIKVPRQIYRRLSFTAAVCRVMRQTVNWMSERHRSINNATFRRRLQAVYIMDSSVKHGRLHAGNNDCFLA